MPDCSIRERNGKAFDTRVSSPRAKRRGHGSRKFLRPPEESSTGVFAKEYFNGHKGKERLEDASTPGEGVLDAPLVEDVLTVGHEGEEVLAFLGGVAGVFGVLVVDESLSL